MPNINENQTTSLSQKKQILAYMKEGNRITPIEALNLFGCFRLPARIADIKADGISVKSEFVKVGPHKKSVKAYWL